MQTRVINLISGPCSGKSTTAFGLFYELKRRGYEVEVATEVAKDYCWEGTTTVLDDQIYVFGKQYHKLYNLNNKVQYIITDSPLLLSIIYSKLDSDAFNTLVLESFDKFDNVNYFIERSEEFYTKGRYHSKEQSIEIDNRVKDIMNQNNYEFKTIKNSEAIEFILNDLGIE